MGKRGCKVRLKPDGRHRTCRRTQKIPICRKRRRLFSTEPTVEKAARLVHGNPREVATCPRRASGLDWRHGPLLAGRRQRPAFWLQAYGGRHWTPDRVKDGEHTIIIPHLLWGLSGGIQPDRVASKLLAGDDDGLAARLLYAWPDPMPPRRPTHCAGSRSRACRAPKVGRVAREPPEPVILPFTGRRCGCASGLPGGSCRYRARRGRNVPILAR